MAVVTHVHLKLVGSVTLSEDCMTVMASVVMDYECLMKDVMMVV